MTVKAWKLVNYLKEHAPGQAGWLNRMKTIYRPLICPLNELIALIPEGSSVFDIGCGNGSFLALAAAYAQPARLGGVEITAELADNARSLLRKSAPGIPASVAVYDGLHFPDELVQYDTVFMTDVFHHIAPGVQGDVLKNLHSHMKKGALFVMKDIDAGKWPLHYMNKIHDLAAAGEIGHEITADAMAELLEHCGFTVTSLVRKTMLVYPHYTITCLA
jgi:cyclopropane fatty-acyl-phospholipid synthase-like methyltransferase